ncbi:MAG TPA: NAD(P)/FAD-dependent oxidoreductase [Rhabdochlamydiaceae bacterium]|nr:NAD(P)/FAD-dependent oxidoreductase [Rhabdochlamydiaceae bacterium]
MFRNLLFSMIMLASQNLFSHQQSPKVVVIGAGLSGLITAYRLHKEGWDVDLYEARNRVGGRIFTVNIEGHLDELGGRNILDGGSAEHMKALINEMGLETEEAKTHLQIYYSDDGELYEFEEILKDREFVPEALKSQLELLKKSSRNMQEVLQALFDENDILYKVCAVHLSGYEGADIDKLSTNYVWTLYNYLLGGISAANQTSCDQEKTYFEYLMIKGGNYLLAERLAEKLSTRLHLNHELKKITKSPMGSYLLSFQNGKQVTADILVLAIPCPTYKNISIGNEVIPSKKQSDIENICYAQITRVSLPLPPLQAKEAFYTNGRMVTMINQDKSILDLHYISQLHEATLEETLAKDFSFLQKIYGIDSSPHPIMASDESLSFYKGAVAHSWAKDRFAQGAYSCCGAGQEELFTSTIEIGGKKVKTLFAPIDNSLFFAGEHTSILVDVCGTMEAAVEAGIRAAWLVDKCCLKH